MNLLLTLPETPRQDEPWKRALFPAASNDHPGPMRVILGQRLVRAAKWELGEERLRVVDPTCGRGTTGVAAFLEGAAWFEGCELVRKWLSYARTAMENALPHNPTRGCWYLQAARAESTEPVTPKRDAHLLLMSPEWPQSHSPGASAQQAKLRETKGLVAGTEFSEPCRWGPVERPNLFGPPWGYRSNLKAVLANWLPCVRRPAGRALIHVKNYMAQGKEVRVDEWTAEVLSDLGWNVLGYIAAPLGYVSWFQQQHLSAGRKIVTEERVVVAAPG